MYECVRDDGSRYTSDDGEGNPRWISSWSSYGGPWRRGSGITYGRGQAAPAATTASPRSDTSSGNGAPTLRFRQIRRASCRARVCQHVSITVVAVTLHNTTHNLKLQA